MRRRRSVWSGQSRTWKLTLGRRRQVCQDVHSQSQTMSHLSGTNTIHHSIRPHLHTVCVWVWVWLTNQSPVSIVQTHQWTSRVALKQQHVQTLLTEHWKNKKTKVINLCVQTAADWPISTDIRLTHNISKYEELDWRSPAGEVPCVL